MIPFCGLVEGFRDPKNVASISFDKPAQEFESLLRSSRQNIQSLGRLIPALSKAKTALTSIPLMSQDRRFFSIRQQRDKIRDAISMIDNSIMCRDFDKKVLPFAFAFARERARESSRLAQGEFQKSEDSHINARLARFMAHDWIRDTGKPVKHPYEQVVLYELTQVKQWLQEKGDNYVVNAWSSAALAPILYWEESISKMKSNEIGEVVNQTAPEFHSVPSDAVWSLAIHVGGVEAWLKSLVKIGYVPVQAPISSSGSTSASVLEASQTLTNGEEQVVPAPLSFSYAILQSTLSYLPAFLSHTNRRTLSINRTNARASKEAAALKAQAKMNLEEEERGALDEDEEHDEDEEDKHPETKEQDSKEAGPNYLASLMSSLYGDVRNFNTMWKQVRTQVPEQLANLFHQALATPFLSTSSSAAKKRKKWLQDAVQSNSVQTQTFSMLHMSNMDGPPLKYATVPVDGKAKKLKPLLEQHVVAPKHEDTPHPLMQERIVVAPPPLHVPAPPAPPPVPAPAQGIQSQQIIHELQMELSQRGWAEATSQSCCYLTSHDTCDICHIPMEYATDLPIQVCPQCFSTRMTLSQYGKPEENSLFSKYVRKAHFRTYMQQVQYQEQTRIDIEDIFKVANFLAEHGFNSTNGTVGAVRWALLKLKMNRCYNHVTQIFCRVFNKPPPHFTPAQQKILFDMFDAIYDPYFSAPNKGRSNFLSYQFVIYKSCEIHGWNSFLPFFKMLKGDQNIITHDIIWKYICEQRKWQFIPTLSTQYVLPEFAQTYQDPLIMARVGPRVIVQEEAKTPGRKPKAPRKE